MCLPAHVKNEVERKKMYAAILGGVPAEAARPPQEESRHVGKRGIRAPEKVAKRQKTMEQNTLRRES